MVPEITIITWTHFHHSMTSFVPTTALFSPCDRLCHRYPVFRLFAPPSSPHIDLVPLLPCLVCFAIKYSPENMTESSPTTGCAVHLPSQFFRAMLACIFTEIAVFDSYGCCRFASSIMSLVVFLSTISQSDITHRLLCGRLYLRYLSSLIIVARYILLNIVYLILPKSPSASWALQTARAYTRLRPSSQWVSSS